MTNEQALTLVIVAVGAAVAPLFSGWLRIPAAVGEILFGLVAGFFFVPSGAALAFLPFLAHFGFLLLMFLAGLEIDVHSLAKQSWSTIARLLPFAILAPFLGIAVAVLVGQPALMGLIVGAISIGVAMPVLQELRLLRTQVGQNILLIGAVGELVTIALLALLGNAGSASTAPVLALEVVKLAAIFGVAGLVLTALREVLWWRPLPMGRLLRVDDPTELGMRAAVAVMALFAALATFVGVPDILATFVAGMTIGAVFQGRETVVAKLGSAGFGVLIPVFFIKVGWDVDVRAFLDFSTLELLGVLFGATLAVRLLAGPALWLSCRGGDAVRSLLLLSGPLTLQVAVAEFGIASHVLSASVRPAVVGAACLSAVCWPTLGRLLLARRAAPTCEARARVLATGG